MTTFTNILDGLLRGEPGRPLITFYDHASGERTELSVTTYANWVAKTASLLTEEYDAERGQRVRIDLPTHWLGPVFLGAAWTVGLVPADADDAEVVVCGPDSLDRWASNAGRAVVLATALHPLGMRFTDPLPKGCTTSGPRCGPSRTRSCPLDPPGPGDLATPDLEHGELWAAAAAGELVHGGDRVLTEENPASPSGLSSFTESLVQGGSLVLVAHAEPERLEALVASERVTLRAP